MSETESRSVQEIAIQGTKLLSEFFIAAFAVYIVPDNGVADRRKMYPDLMRASRLDPNLEKRKTTEFFEHFVLGICRAAPRFARRHFRADRRMSSDGQFDCSSTANELAMDK